MPSDLKQITFFTGDKIFFYADIKNAIEPTFRQKSPDQKGRPLAGGDRIREISALFFLVSVLRSKKQSNQGAARKQMLSRYDLSCDLQERRERWMQCLNMKL